MSGQGRTHTKQQQRRKGGERRAGKPQKPTQREQQQWREQEGTGYRGGWWKTACGSVSQETAGGWGQGGKGMAGHRMPAPSAGRALGGAAGGGPPAAATATCGPMQLRATLSNRRSISGATRVKACDQKE